MKTQDILIQLKEAGIKNQIIADAVGTSRETICRIRNGKTQDGHTGKTILESLQQFHNEVNPLQTFQAVYEKPSQIPDYSDAYEGYPYEYSDDEGEYSGFRLNMRWLLLIGGLCCFLLSGLLAKGPG